MKKVNIATLMLASALVLGGCSNNTEKAPAEETPAQSEVSTEEASTAETDVTTAETDASTEEASTEETKEEPVTSTDAETAEGNVILHRGYPTEENGRSISRIVVATSGDKIVAASINEYQYDDKDGDYEGVKNSDGGFGEGTAEGKVLISKLDNEETYSAKMKEAGSPTSLAETYKGIEDFAVGKTIEELETYLNETEDQEIIDAISSATFHSTPTLLKQIVEVAKDDAIKTVGFAENPEAITLKSATAAPHGDKSFADVVVAMEGDKIVAASFDEFQYMADAQGLAEGDSGFVEGFADSSNVLASKIENNEQYSKNMKEKAEATTEIKANFEAIQNFVAGKTVAEVEEALGNVGEDGTVDGVTGATLVDTAGYLQAIVDTAKM
ncbi:MAG: peptidoglycan-binding protein [Anaerococcus sp.]|nr:peptidoglycan-binding protein [Anaerococcus sp.]MDD7044018.1 peptidoglycan-binding protein [Peptoniphilaceae bacterium]MDY2919183.1 peptidoglycan-binding protein [Anaerococcus sp.]